MKMKYTYTQEHGIRRQLRKDEHMRQLIYGTLFAILCFIIALFVVFALFMAIDNLAARAQEFRGYMKDHNLYHPNYERLYNAKTRKSCCNQMDCRPTMAERREGKWYAYVDGAEREIPDYTILDNQSFDLMAHVCATMTGEILCFIPPIRSF